MRPSTTLLAAALLASMAPACLAEETSRSGHLYDELALMDSEFFEAAFVTCDAEKFKAIFTADDPFYYDRTSISLMGTPRTTDSCPHDEGVTRTLVPGTLEVSPLKGYGALQVGYHTFSRAGERGTETTRFVHLWKREGATWKLRRAYNHVPKQGASSRGTAQ